MKVLPYQQWPERLTPITVNGEFSLLFWHGINAYIQRKCTSDLPNGGCWAVGFESERQQAGGWLDPAGLEEDTTGIDMDWRPVLLKTPV